MRLAVLVAVVLVASFPTHASEPGQPLDCSDWVFLEPGLSCSDYVAYPCDGEHCELDYHRVEVDNEGFFYRIEMAFDVGATCDGKTEDRLQLVRHEGEQSTVVGYVQDRCNDTTYDRVRPEGAGVRVLASGSGIARGLRHPSRAMP